MFKWHVVSAVFWRNLKQFFSGALGYVLVVVLVAVSALLAFSPRFFAENLANLDQLSSLFPRLLVVFIPAITMSAWAEERRQGTDAILFTLPASDFQILLGKYLSVAAVYTISLLFSTTMLIAIGWIGDPDWGVMFTTYVGYWLVGLALLAIGMFASSLTNSTTIAFVIGAAFCSIPVFIGHYLQGHVWFERLGVDWYLREFTIGLIPFSGLVYFGSIIVLMLYLNLIVIGHRHWGGGEKLNMGSQFTVRALSVAVALVALNIVVWYLGSSIPTRMDLTQEKLYTLDQTTLDTLANAKENKRPVTIQAFVSRDVPRKYVNTKKHFTSLLRQYAQKGGGYVTLRMVDVAPNSKEEEEALTLQIEPLTDRSDVGGVQEERKVYLGAHISSTLDDVTLPFIGNDKSTEYELSRAIAKATDNSYQMTLGIVDTDARFGGPEIDGRRLEWAYNGTLSQLKNQYKIKHLAMDDIANYLPKTVGIGGANADGADGEDTSNNAESPDDDDAKAKKTKSAPDVLLVADPSSLSQPATDDLIKYIEAGNAVVILADPLPFFWTFQNPQAIGVINAPRMNRIAAQSPYHQLLGSSVMPKADGGSAAKLLSKLGIEWDNGAAAWSIFNPHPNFNGAWAEEMMGPTWPKYYGPYEKALVWVRSHGDVKSFSQESPISRGLKELLFFYPGSIKQSSDSQTEFTPLVTIGPQSGSTPWDKLTTTPKQGRTSIDPRTGQRKITETAARSQITGDDLVVIEPTPETSMDETDYCIAGLIQGQGDSKINVAFIADTDFLSDLYTDQEKALGQTLDNVTFLQNAIDVLAGNEGFVRLRNRRPTPRTLTRVETQKEAFRADRTKRQEEAEKEVREKLEEAQEKLDVAAEEIGSDDSLSFIEKLQRTSQEAGDAQRVFNLQKKDLDDDLAKTIGRLKTEESNKISGLEDFIRGMSLLLSMLPALILGLIVFLVRMQNERTQISDDRRV